MTAHTDKSPADIAQDLRNIADAMATTAADLDYYGGLNEQWASMARWLETVSRGVTFFASKVEPRQ